MRSQWFYFVFLLPLSFCSFFGHTFLCSLGVMHIRQKFSLSFTTCKPLNINVVSFPLLEMFRTILDYSIFSISAIVFRHLPMTYWNALNVLCVTILKHLVYKYIERFFYYFIFTEIVLFHRIILWYLHNTTYTTFVMFSFGLSLQ